MVFPVNIDTNKVYAEFKFDKHQYFTIEIPCPVVVDLDNEKTFKCVTSSRKEQLLTLRVDGTGEYTSTNIGVINGM